jgi:hypothetical protein
MPGGASITAVCALSTGQVPRQGKPKLGRVGWVAISAAACFSCRVRWWSTEAEKACAAFPLCPAAQRAGLAAPAPPWYAVFLCGYLTAHVLVARLATLVRHLGSLRLNAALVGTTATLGIVSALLKAPPAWQDRHLAGAAAVLATSMALGALGWLSGADRTPDEPDFMTRGGDGPAQTKALAATR